MRRRRGLNSCKGVGAGAQSEPHEPHTHCGSQSEPHIYIVFICFLLLVKGEGDY